MNSNATKWIAVQLAIFFITNTSLAQMNIATPPEPPTRMTANHGPSEFAARRTNIPWMRVMEASTGLSDVNQEVSRLIGLRHTVEENIIPYLGWIAAAGFLGLFLIQYSRERKRETQMIRAGQPDEFLFTAADDDK